MPKIVVITGGSAGVGRAAAREFARQGASVAILARGEDGLEATAHELGALALPADVADWRQVEAAAEAVERRLGPIDVWVNNAMATVFSPFERITPAEFQRVTDVTYMGYVHGTRAALAHMRPRDHGTIVQVGSALAYRSIPLQSAYCGAKAAIRGFTDALRGELLHDRSRIRLTMVQLPAHDTPQFAWGRSHMPRRPRPVPPIYRPELAAEAIAWAADHAPRELHVGFSTTAAIQATKLFPGLLDRYLARQGYRGQLTDAPATPHLDNLFAPVPGDHGAHGPYRRDERAGLGQLWLAERGPRLAIALGLAGLAYMATRRSSYTHPGGIGR